MQKNIFRQVFLYIILIELFSLFAFLMPAFMPFAFIILVFITLILSLQNLKYGVYVLFLELIIGSLGYLFWLDIGSFKISIRIALFSIIILVWFLKLLFQILREKNFLAFKNIFNKKLKYFYILFIFIILALVNAYFQGNNLKDIFFDFNAWIYFLLIFPILNVFQDRKDLNILIKILSAGLFWIVLETFILLFVFSHNFSFLPELYRWIRDTRVGEITRFNSGFVRIFFQSHIYFIPAFFYAFYKFLVLKISNPKYSRIKTLSYFVAASSFLSLIILGYSRSNWLGFLFALFLFFVFLFWKKYKLKNILKAFLFLGSSALYAFLFITLIINFPLPGQKNNLNALSLVGDRASRVSSEAGVSSRWNLLPVLWKEIKTAPVFGKGFGKNVIYISNDPRVREKNPDGVYQTYSFEWGWLDVWLKLGFLGLLAYLVLLFNIILNTFKIIKKNTADKIFLTSFLFGLFSMIVIHFFSPYLNHPLGIAYLTLLASFVL